MEPRVSSTLCKMRSSAGTVPSWLRGPPTPEACATIRLRVAVEHEHLLELHRSRSFARSFQSYRPKVRGNYVAPARAAETPPPNRVPAPLPRQDFASEHRVC